MPTHNQMANAIRFLSIDAVEAANSGHPGMPMGMADVATVLFRDFMKFDPAKPGWANRDRFVLSAGHGSMLLYALGYLTGYPDMTIDQLRRFRQLKSLTPGHPEVHIAAGIEMTTGPLGQGLSSAVGMALGEQIVAARAGHDAVGHKTYVICSDGDLQEGVTHETCALAGHWRLRNLVVLYDSNDIQIDGATALAFSEDVGARFLAYGWAVDTVDGHDERQIQDALGAAQNADRPTMIICKTQIGYGSPGKAKTHHAHGSPLGAAEVLATRQFLEWTHEPFDLHDDVLAAWRAVGRKGRALSSRHPDENRDLARKDSGVRRNDVAGIVADLKQQFLDKKPNQATRKSSGDVLEKLVAAMPQLIGGSADLTPSNNTRVAASVDIAPGNYGGNYIHYGVREFGMAAIMNGLALYGFIPYGGTFLQFSDYSRPALRLAALMRQRVIHVLTHDSIGLGEDGPTHQPVEHFAALRAIPNLQFLRPCDAIETAECWQLALDKTDGPTALALSRQNLPTLRLEAGVENLCALGGYVLRPATPSPRPSPTGGEGDFVAMAANKTTSPLAGEGRDEGAGVTLIATGSEVALAIEVQQALQDKGITSQVVSMPCREAFMRQPLAYRAAVLGAGRRIVIEAGIRQGWEGIMGEDGLFFGVETFGESAPYQEIYAHFGLAVENIVAKITQD